MNGDPDDSGAQNENPSAGEDAGEGSSPQVERPCAVEPSTTEDKSSQATTPRAAEGTVYIPGRRTVPNAGRP